MPVCSRTLFWVICATVWPMSAFWMLSTALVRLVTSVLSTFALAVSWFTVAPIVPRSAATVLIAA